MGFNWVSEIACAVSDLFGDIWFDWEEIVGGEVLINSWFNTIILGMHWLK